MEEFEVLSDLADEISVLPPQPDYPVDVFVVCEQLWQQLLVDNL